MAQTRDELVDEVAERARDQAERCGDKRPGLRELAEHGADGLGADEDALLRSSGCLDGEDRAGSRAGRDDEAGAGDEGRGAWRLGGDEAQASMGIAAEKPADGAAAESALAVVDD